MKKLFGNKTKVWMLGALAVVSGSIFSSCNDEIAEENRFTFTGELIADHLENNPEKFSSFCEILDKAKIGKKAGSMLTTLSTYGSYTCFAPTNKAIENYLQEKYAEWKESYDQNQLDSTVKIKNTGITSPLLEELSDSMATEIAKNHILELGLTTIEVGRGAFPKKTMNRRSVMLSWKNDDKGYAIALVDGAVILEQNIETENGYIHVLESALAPSDQPTSSLLSSQPAFTLFSEALEKTGFDEYLETYELDPDYDGLGQYGPKFKTQNNQEPPYPEAYNQGYTLFVETDELLADPSKNNLGEPILTVEDLEWYAAQWYGNNINKEKKEFDYKGDYKNPKNPLYQFIAYHIVDRKLLYSSSKGPGGFIMENYQTLNNKGEVDKGKFDSEENMPTNFDRTDYFETALPYTTIKVTKPFSSSDTHMKYGGESETPIRDELILNYTTKGANIPGMDKHINVVIEEVSTTRQRPKLEEFQDQAVNGFIYTIDKILIYNEDEMGGNVLNERMRWDVFSLFPELTNNDVRWLPEDNNYTLVYIPEGYCKRLKHNNTDTNIYYLRPHNAMWDGGYANYQGDEMLVTGKYDFQYRIPYVPEGTYEIRFGFSTSDSRGIAQFYFDNKICGIPLDMRDGNRDFMGWFDDTDNEEENRKNDKSMRNRGFMKAPASIHLGAYNASGPTKSMRFATHAFRRVIGTYELERGKDYWLRFKDVTEGGTADAPNEFNQDYIEIVPISILNDPSKPEDIY